MNLIKSLPIIACLVLSTSCSNIKKKTISKNSYIVSRNIDLTSKNKNEKKNSSSSTVPYIDNFAYRLDVPAKNIINKNKLIQDQNIMYPSFDGDGFFLQITPSEKTMFECLLKNKNKNTIDCQVMVLKNILNKHIKFSKPKVKFFNPANITEIAQIFCANPENELSQYDIQLCDGLTSSNNETSTEILKIKSQLQNDLGTIKLTIFQQVVGGIEIANNTLIVVQPSWTKKTFIYGNIMSVEDTDYTKTMFNYTFCEKNQNQENINDCIYQRFISEHANLGINSIENGQCNPNFVSQYIFYPVNYKSFNGNENINLKMHERYKCNAEFSGVIGSWDVLIDSTGSINKSTPLFAFYGTITTPKNTDSCKPICNSKIPTNCSLDKIDLCGWPIHPIDHTPYIYKDIRTWDQDVNINVNKLMQRSIFKELETADIQPHKVDLLNINLEHPIPYNDDCTNVKKYLDARLINTFIHLDRQRRLTTSVGINIFNKKNINSLIFPTKSIKTILNNKYISSASHESMTLKLGHNYNAMYYDRMCKSSGDSTHISHEFSHLVVDDIRKQIFPIDVAIELGGSLHDLADTMATVYASCSTTGVWSNIFKRSLNEYDTLPSKNNREYDQYHYQDQIFGRIVNKWIFRNKNDNGLINKIAIWARLVRAASIYIPMPKIRFKNKISNEDTDLDTYRRIQRMVMVYFMQMIDTNEEYLISEYIGQMHNSGISLLPWQCLNKNTNKRIPNFCINNTNSYISTLTMVEKNKYLLNFMKSPKVLFDEDGSSNIVDDCNESFCSNNKFYLNISENMAFDRSIVKPIKRNICIDSFYIPNPKKGGNLYLQGINNDTRTNLIPVFGEIKPFRIEYINQH